MWNYKKPPYSEKNYHIRHDGTGEDREPNWNIYFNQELVLSCRAKSRSKYETQMLLDHMNKIIERAKQ